ncbi:MAG: site-2 protease family protein [Candidatus Competibacteraceae bacterium]|nr:site-2 protease family protein [Candidatus Competibacteraceae bacterium]MBK7984282.1 site-2 protease family protein [Candidatus Competibacteraceae bacterium]MBK8896249.1 site-2 protease family protein [Candidatus Competibacteraceae bacterium]MBK8964941.1 site-2 protease family protein [Candidatus Competibacteraceae bacterium]MBK9950223.1 site-2 protease family protein [Candidatus Competibacteraceae bacterium]
MQDLNAIQLIVLMAPPLLFAITLHEVAHGWAALRFGDTTAQSQGRLSLNPLRHVDPVGTVLVPGLLYVLGGFIFGWAKPVPVNYQRLRHPKRDMALVALAGPTANLLMALGWGLLALVGHGLEDTLAWAGEPLLLMGVVGIDVNVMLGVLNLLPVPPLDGSRVLAGFLPERFGLLMARFEPYGLMVLLFLLVSGVLDLMPLVSSIRNFIITLFFS